MSNPVPADPLTTYRMPHIPELDGMRAVAVGMVFIGHTHLLPRFSAGFGVTLFFFLSGYLITTLLRLERAEHGRINLGHFYLRRFLRINPPLYVSLALIGLLVAIGINPQVPNLPGLLGQIFFFANYLPDFGRYGGLQSPLWSLAVEEHFYLVFPSAFIVAMRRGSPARLALWCALACAAVLAVRIVNVEVFGIVIANGFWTHTRIDSILFGCILALWSNPVVEREPSWRASNRQAFVALLVIAASFLPAPPIVREGFRYTLQGLALLVIFNRLLQGHAPGAALLRHPFVQRLGLWSYTFYLVHYAMLGSAKLLLAGIPQIMAVLVAFAAACLVCELMYRVVEKPAARLRRRFAA